MEVPDSHCVCVCVADRQRLFENLRMLPHAPGVQMQAIPEDSIPDDNVDEDAEDPDKRLSSKIAYPITAAQSQLTALHRKFCRIRITIRK